MILDMKLFKVIIVLSSLLVAEALARNKKPGDAKGTIGDMPPPMLLGDDLKYSMPAYLFRHTQFMRFRLNSTEKKLHESAVFFALTNAENGKIVSWYSKKRLAKEEICSPSVRKIGSGSWSCCCLRSGSSRCSTRRLSRCKARGTRETCLVAWPRGAARRKRRWPHSS